MKRMDKAQELFVLALLIVLLICFVGVVYVQAEETEEDEGPDIAWAQCSDISSECVEYLYPNRLACENQVIPTFYCVSVNLVDK